LEKDPTGHRPTLVQCDNATIDVLGRSDAEGILLAIHKLPLREHDKRTLDAHTHSPPDMHADAVLLTLLLPEEHIAFIKHPHRPARAVVAGDLVLA
jgi:hypothetical protein